MIQDEFGHILIYIDDTHTANYQRPILHLTKSCYIQHILKYYKTSILLYYRISDLFMSINLAFSLYRCV